MDVEDRLQGFRLRASAGALRASVLGAARRASRERRLWRWTWAAAALVFAIVIPVNLSLDGVPARATEVPAAETDEGLRLRYRLASTPRTSPFPRKEIR
jgi:hypothetical protein